MADTRLAAGVPANLFIDLLVRLVEGNPIVKTWLNPELSGHP
jgi:hypothetical protein